MHCVWRGVVLRTLCGVWMLGEQIETGHLDNPYHNATHVADVVQSMHCLITKVPKLSFQPPPLTPLHKANGEGREVTWRVGQVGQVRAAQVREACRDACDASKRAGIDEP